MKRIKFIGTEGETEVPGIGLFKRDETRELSDELANKLLSNVNFIDIQEERKPEKIVKKSADKLLGKTKREEEIIKEPAKEKKEEDFRW